MNDIETLQNVKQMSVADMGLTEINGKKGKGLFFLLKRIILDQEKRIQELEFQLAEIRGEVEPE